MDRISRVRRLLDPTNFESDVPARSA
jgi:hypothetical protein